MNERDVRALDWVRVHCEPAPLPQTWVWPSGYRHSEQESIMIARMCQALGREPSDLITSDLFDALVSRVLQLEERLSDVEERAK